MADLNSMEFKSGVDLANDSNMMALGVIKRRMTKEERLRAKEAAAPTVDAQGNVIHPDIPKFIADAPWYMAEESGKSLSHQKSVYGYDKYGMDPAEWYARGQRAGPAATKYRKGACENCGAMTHKSKECLERPRKLGARFTGKDIQPDEIIRRFDQTFEGKRDRWNGYDNREFAKHMEDYEKIEDARKALKEAQKAAGVVDPTLSDDEDKYEFEPDTPGQGYDEKTRTSVRNLRIREDIAKYLLSSSNSSHYDPKSRSMRELPDGTNVLDDPKLQNGTQEFHRSEGDAADFEKLQKFAWQSERMGGDIHLQANPTMGELKHKKVVEQKEHQRSAIRSSVLDKYGGVEHLDAPPKELLKSTEQFVEYTAKGEVLKGREEPKTKSRYTEDGMRRHNKANGLVYTNNHTSVYGSWYRDGRWGYACCHQYHKNSYCTGQAGIEADEAAMRLAKGEIQMPPPPQPKKPNTEALSQTIKDRKRKHAGDGIKQLEGRSMTAAESALVSSDEYEDYRRNKMTRSDDPLLAMKELEGKV
jgi:pre-mRNA-processing factor SLU7